MATLSVPLNDRVTNFEKLHFNYIPPSVRKQRALSHQAREEINEISNLLHISGAPSRANIIHYLKIENITQQGCSKHVVDLFELIEHEENPFTISKKAKVALEALKSDEKLKKYAPFVAKSISVRILQKCTNFYSQLKVEKLIQTLPMPYNEEVTLLELLFECNRESLIFTTLSIIKNEAVLGFNQEASVSASLFQFGQKMKEVFTTVKQSTAHGKVQRQRIFLKVKEKLDEEIQLVKTQKDEMQQAQKKLAEKKARDAKLAAENRVKDEERKKREQDEQKVRDEQRRKRGEILDKLDLMKKQRAIEILGSLRDKGFKKVKKERIKDLLEKTDKIVYDDVIEFYQGILKREREQIEEDKKKKMREVELWQRALREEEKMHTVSYAQKHGDEKMKAIQESMRERQEKEAKDREALSTAASHFKGFMTKAMTQRSAEWVTAKEAFVRKQMEQLKETVLDAAKKDLMLEENRVLQQKRQEEMRKKDLERQKKEMAEGTYRDPEDEEGPGGWGRGAAMGKRSEEGPRFGGERREPAGGDGDTGFITRSNRARNTQPEEEKKAPRREEREDGAGGFSRAGFTRRTDEASKPAGSGPPKFSRGGATRPAAATTEKPSEGGTAGWGAMRSNTKRK